MSASITVEPENVERTDAEVKLSLKTAREMLVGKSFVNNAKYTLRVVRHTPYIDNMLLKQKYLEVRDQYYVKMQSVSENLRSNNRNLAFMDLVSAIESDDTSNLWSRKASLAKTLNDNKIDVLGSLIGVVTAYASSVGALIPIMFTVLEKGFATFDPSNFLMFFLLAILLFGFWQGWFNQNRLRRLVKEHKDYLGEYAEIDELINRKKNSLATMTLS